MHRIGQHAVVIGASMGGLLAARVLADFFDVVSVVERDILPEAGEPRKGVPQGKHTHGLHAYGRAILEQLFPGFTEEMVAQGGLKVDVCNDFRWFVNGGFHQPGKSGLVGLILSRPRLEAGVGARVKALPNVELLENCDVLGLATTADRSRVTGIRLVRRSAGTAEETLAADLVVDASGRGSRTPAWLAELGYDKPEEERVEIDVCYVSCQFKRKAGELHGLAGFAIAGAAPDGRNGVVLAQEGDRWAVTLAGYNGDFSPTDLPGFLEFARGLPTPEMYNLLKDAEPVTEPLAYRFPANQRRHYEKLNRFPEGYVVFGDAICSFNPVYGQGMTVAANEALALQNSLSQGGAQIGQRFFKAIQPIVDAPWQVAVGNDLQLPHVKGKRTAIGNFINWYLNKLHAAAHNDAALSIAFLKVVNMMEVPPSLLHPRMIVRVVKGNLGQPKHESGARLLMPAPAQS